MSEILANKLSPSTGTSVQLGDSGDTFNIPSGVTLTNSGTMNASAITAGTLPIARGGTGSTSTTFVNAATNITGNLPVANLNGGSSASSSTFWRGDGAWAAAGGGLQLVTSFTPGSEGSTINVDNCFTATYDRYLVFCERLRNGNDQARLDVYLRTGGSSGSDNCNLGGGYLGYRYNNQYMSGSISNSCQGVIASNVKQDRWYNAMMYFIQPYDSAYTTNIQGQSVYREGSNDVYGFINFGYQPDNTDSHTGFAIQLSSGNFNQTQTTIKVYGIVDS